MKSGIITCVRPSSPTARAAPVTQRLHMHAKMEKNTWKPLHHIKRNLRCSPKRFFRNSSAATADTTHVQYAPCIITLCKEDNWPSRNQQVTITIRTRQSQIIGFTAVTQMLDVEVARLPSTTMYRQLWGHPKCLRFLLLSSGFRPAGIGCTTWGWLHRRCPTWRWRSGIGSVRRSRRFNGGRRRGGRRTGSRHN